MTRPERVLLAMFALVVLTLAIGTAGFLFANGLAEARSLDGAARAAAVSLSGVLIMAAAGAGALLVGRRIVESA